MKIAQVTPSLETRHGGPSRSVYGLSAALARDGADVSLLATGPGGAEAHANGPLEVEIFPRGRPASICVSPGLRDRLLRADVAVIHHHSLWLRTLDYARRAAARGGAKLVISPRGMMSDWAWAHHGFRKRLARRLVHPGAMEAAKGWHATSEQEAADIRSRGFGQPICVAPNGVGLPTQEETAEAVRHWREACPESADRPVALFYSRFHRKKRVLELIDLWRRVAPRDWLLLVAGIPEDYTVASLEAHLLAAGDADSVRVVDGTGRPPPYAVASLFLLPSHSENFGLVIAEAMASGVPALVTDSTPWGALNANGGGWCVPWADYPAAVRGAVAEGVPALRARGAKARSWVLREYSWEKSARVLAEFYEKL